MQKEKLSALMDGEALDSELMHFLSKDKMLQQSWQSYHLIRDTLRGDVGDVVYPNIARSVAIALKTEPVSVSSVNVLESQPQPHVWQKLPFWQKIRPWISQITQVGVAACISLVVIVGVQQYNNPVISNIQTESPVFNTLPMLGGEASPVSFGVPEEGSFSNSQHYQEQEQRRRMIVQLQKFELERRIPNSQLEQSQDAIQIPVTPSSGIKQQ